jgi:hypothetical protein
LGKTIDSQKFAISLNDSHQVIIMTGPFKMPNSIRLRLTFVLIALSTFFLVERNTTAQEPGWYPYTIARGSDREMIRQTPLLLRPYRPLHFYGNTQRRMYYRGNPLPQYRDRQPAGNSVPFRSGVPQNRAAAGPGWILFGN